MSTADEKRYMDRVASMCCIVCALCLGIQDSPALVHHVRSSQGKMRACDYDTLPLCPPHHDNHPDAFHVLGAAGFAEKYGISEIQLLHIVQDRLRKYLPPGHQAPRDPYAVDVVTLKKSTDTKVTFDVDA